MGGGDPSITTLPSRQVPASQYASEEAVAGSLNATAFFLAAAHQESQFVLSCRLPGGAVCPPLQPLLTDAGVCIGLNLPASPAPVHVANAGPSQVYLALPQACIQDSATGGGGKAQFSTTGGKAPNFKISPKS